MRADVKHDFIIAMSILMLCAVFNKTIMRALSDYEAFSAISEVKSINWKGYFTSKYFLFPNLYSILTIIWFLVWLILHSLKRQA